MFLFLGLVAFQAAVITLFEVVSDHDDRGNLSTLGF